MSQLYLSLLGSFQVSSPAHQKDVPFATDKMRALFAYLAMEVDRPFRRDTLAALFWGESPNTLARGNLRKELYRFRRLLSRTMPLSQDKEAFSITRQTIQLNSGVLKVDALTFQERLASCSEHSHRHLHTCLPCLERLSEAVALYDGEFMQGFSLADACAFEEWLTIERERLHHQMMGALSQLAEASIERGEYENALNFAQKQIALEAWQESAHRQVMRLFALHGEVPKALEQYGICRQILADELGVEPDSESKTLYQQLKNGRSDSADTKRAPVLHHFPTQLTPEIGRYENVAVIISDIVGFTEYCDNHEPEEVLTHLQELVEVFEEVALTVGVRKIKTIGDAIMGTAGLLGAVDNPVLACVQCGLKMVEIAPRLAAGWKVRVGIHVGAVVAGVVEPRRYNFDIWGKTVKMTARIESTGLPNAVNVSREAWQQIASDCIGQSRGKISLWGKGEKEVFRVDGLQ